MWQVSWLASCCLPSHPFGFGTVVLEVVTTSVPINIGTKLTVAGTAQAFLKLEVRNGKYEVKKIHF
jgi:hypothetical protein